MFDEKNARLDPRSVITSVSEHKYTLIAKNVTKFGGTLTGNHSHFSNRGHSNLRVVSVPDRSGLPNVAAWRHRSAIDKSGGSADLSDPPHLSFYLC